MGTTKQINSRSSSFLLIFLISHLFFYISLHFSSSRLPSSSRHDVNSVGTRRRWCWGGLRQRRGVFVNHAGGAAYHSRCSFVGRRESRSGRSQESADDDGAGGKRRRAS